jgi:hypothetical protein
MEHLPSGINELECYEYLIETLNSVASKFQELPQAHLSTFPVADFTRFAAAMAKFARIDATRCVASWSTLREQVELASSAQKYLYARSA